MDTLPTEIFHLILCFLDEKDWIECLHVSRFWRAEVPIAVGLLFTHLTINAETRAYLNVVHHFPSLCRLTMWELIPLKGIPPVQITGIEYPNYLFPTAAEAIVAFKEHAAHIESLSFCIKVDQQSDVIYYLLASCPDLKRLRVIAGNNAVYTTSYYPFDAHTVGYYPKYLFHGGCHSSLVVLDVDAFDRIDIYDSLLPLCPNLRFIRFRRLYDHLQEELSPRVILGLYPKLTHLWISKKSSSEMEHFERSWSRDVEAAIPSSSDHLHFLYYDLGEWDVSPAAGSLEEVYLARLWRGARIGTACLKVFECNTIDAADDLICLIRQSPYMERLSICSGKLYASEDLNAFRGIITALGTLTHLRSLRLPSTYSLVTLSQFFSPAMYDSVETLFVSSWDWATPPTHPSQFDFLTFFRRLKVLHLQFTKKEYVMMLPPLPTVKHINLHFTKGLHYISMVYLAGFETLGLHHCWGTQYSSLDRVIASSNKLREVTIIDSSIDSAMAKDFTEKIGKRAKIIINPS